MHMTPGICKSASPLLADAAKALGDRARASNGILIISDARKDAVHPCYVEKEHAFEWSEYDEDGYQAGLRPDGWIGFIPNGFHKTVLKTTVGNAMEVEELLAWYDQLDEDSLRPASINVPLGYLLTDFSMVVLRSGEARLLPLHRQVLDRLPDALSHLLWRALTGDMMAMVNMGRHECFAKKYAGLLRGKTIELDSRQLQIQFDVQNMDILLNPLVEEKTCHVDGDGLPPESLPMLRAAVDPAFSWMYVSDFFNHTLDGQESLRDCFLSAKSFDDFFDRLAETTVKIPASKDAQIAKAVEWRSARLRYRRAVDDIPRLRADELTRKLEQQTATVWAGEGLHRVSGD